MRQSLHLQGNLNSDRFQYFFLQQQQFENNIQGWRVSLYKNLSIKTINQNSINSYIELAKSVPTIIQGASDFIGGIPDYYDDITQGFRNLGSNVMNLGRRIIGGRSTTTPYRPGTADLSNSRSMQDLLDFYS